MANQKSKTDDPVISFGVSVPESIIAQLDADADNVGMSRSAVVSKILREFYREREAGDGQVPGEDVTT